MHVERCLEKCDALDNSALIQHHRFTLSGMLPASSYHEAADGYDAHGLDASGSRGLVTLDPFAGSNYDLKHHLVSGTIRRMKPTRQYLNHVM